MNVELGLRAQVGGDRIEGIEKGGKSIPGKGIAA